MYRRSSASLSTAATVALAFSVLFFLTRLIFLVQRRLLWRVRRKLILSYIFIGVVPSLLILSFFLLGASFMAGTVAAHLFRNGYDDLAATRSCWPRPPPPRSGGHRAQQSKQWIAFNETARSRSSIRLCRWRSFPPPPTPQRRCRVVPGNI